SYYLQNPQHEFPLILLLFREMPMKPVKQTALHQGHVLVFSFAERSTQLDIEKKAAKNDFWVSWRFGKKWKFTLRLMGGKDPRKKRKRYSICTGARSNGPVTLEWEVIHKVPYVGVFYFDL
ncbi:hypothetical protein STEG23_000797, partial [Scotinomys teguina]